MGFCPLNILKGLPIRAGKSISCHNSFQPSMKEENKPIQYASRPASTFSLSMSESRDAIASSRFHLSLRTPPLSAAMFVCLFVWFCWRSRFKVSWMPVRTGKTVSLPPYLGSLFASQRNLFRRLTSAEINILIVSRKQTETSEQLIGGDVASVSFLCPYRECSCLLSANLMRYGECTEKARLARHRL